MFKKILLVTLTAFTFVGLTGCGSEKKLNAEEAKAEVKLAQENTAKALKDKKGLTIKESAKAKASISAKSIKSGDFEIIKSAKISGSTEANSSVTLDTEKLNAKLSGDAKANLSYNVSSSLASIKQEYNADVKGDAYLINSEDKFNAYIKADANLPKKEDMQSFLSLIGMFSDSEIIDFIEDFDFKEKMSFANNIKFEKDEEMKEFDPQEFIAFYNFDTLIKDWSIFSKKGSTLCADCSKLSAFNFDFDDEMQASLAELGLNLKMSKFEISLNKDNEITGFDFDMSLKGTIDLAKMGGEDDEDSSSLLGGSMKGKITVDCSYGIGIDMTYNEKAETITVPSDLANLPEVDFDDFADEYLDDLDFDDLIPGGNKGEKAAVKGAENVASTLKMVALECSPYANTSVVIELNYPDTASYVPTTFSIKIDGTEDSTGFSVFDFMVDNLDASGTIIATYDASTYKFTFTSDINNPFKVNGYEIVFDANGTASVAK